VADARLPASPFDDFLPAGCSGAPVDPPGLIVAKRRGVVVSSLRARADQAGALTGRLGAVLDLDPPAGPRRVVQVGRSVVGIGPGHWLVLGETGDPAVAAKNLAVELAGLGTVTDLSDALPVLHLSGRGLRQVLARGLPVDLHPSVFRPGDVVSSVVALIPVHLWLLEDGESCEIAVPRSFAGSFAEWLADSAASVGMRVLP